MILYRFQTIFSWPECSVYISYKKRSSGGYQVPQGFPNEKKKKKKRKEKKGLKSIYEKGRFKR